MSISATPFAAYSSARAALPSAVLSFPAASLPQFFCLPLLLSGRISAARKAYHASRMDFSGVLQPFCHMGAERRQGKHSSQTIFLCQLHHRINFIHCMKCLYTADINLPHQFLLFFCLIAHLLRPFPEISTSYLLPMIRTWSMLTGRFCQ